MYYNIKDINAGIYFEKSHLQKSSDVLKKYICVGNAVVEWNGLV